MGVEEPTMPLLEASLDDKHHYPLLELPTELRLMIYKNLTDDFRASDPHAPFNLTAAVLFTCHQILQEAAKDFKACSKDRDFTVSSLLYLYRMELNRTSSSSRITAAQLEMVEMVPRFEEHRLAIDDVIGDIVMLEYCWGGPHKEDDA